VLSVALAATVFGVPSKFGARSHVVHDAGASLNAQCCSVRTSVMSCSRLGSASSRRWTVRFPKPVAISQVCAAFMPREYRQRALFASASQAAWASIPWLVLGIKLVSMFVQRRVVHTCHPTPLIRELFVAVAGPVSRHVEVPSSSCSRHCALRLLSISRPVGQLRVGGCPGGEGTTTRFYLEAASGANPVISERSVWLLLAPDRVFDDVCVMPFAFLFV